MANKDSPPGRPANFSRDDAIDRAMHLFWRDGYLGVSATDLAAAMDIQRSSFYNSFGSREAVFLEALERYSRSAPDKRLDALRPGDAVVPAIVAMFRELCRLRAADPEGRGCLVCNSVGELVGVDERLGTIFVRAIDERIAVSTRVLQQAVDQGEIDLAGDTAAAARAFVAFLLGINLLSKSVRQADFLWETCRAYLAGLGISESDLDATGDERTR